jgi:hypothetical protein
VPFHPRCLVTFCLGLFGFLLTKIPTCILQDLSLDEEAAVPTCNLSETIHNKWYQASGNNSSDLYNATLDDYCRAAKQSTAYHNYLKGGGAGTGPD